MIFRIPSYLKDFKCSASACTDNCCIGWEIDIDEATALYYKNTEGDFGERLRKSISFDNGASFILKDDRCPFLNEKNLCDIIINLGEDKLCHICTEHPRFFGWYGNIKEGGIGMCCEEGARLILNAQKPLEFTQREIPAEQGEEIDGELFSFLCECREIIFGIICDESRSLKERVGEILGFCEMVQVSVDNYVYSVPEFKYELKGNRDVSMADVLKSYRELEPIDEGWTAFLEELTEDYEEIPPDESLSFYGRNIFIYFIYRYFLKDVYDEEILSKVKLAAVSTAVILYIIRKEGKKKKLSEKDIINICKLYSKQVEYSQENLDALADISYENESWKSERIKELF